MGSPGCFFSWGGIDESRVGEVGLYHMPHGYAGFPGGSAVKNPPAMWEIPVRSLGWEDPLEKRRATHSSILTWRIPWTVYPWGCKKLDTTKHLSLHFSGCKLRRSRAGCLGKKLPILWRGGAVRRTQWSQGDKEDGSSSRTQLHEREEGGLGKEPKV